MPQAHELLVAMAALLTLPAHRQQMLAMTGQAIHCHPSCRILLAVYHWPSSPCIASLLWVSFLAERPVVLVATGRTNAQQQQCDI